VKVKNPGDGKRPASVLQSLIPSLAKNKPYAPLQRGLSALAIHRIRKSKKTLYAATKVDSTTRNAETTHALYYNLAGAGNTGPNERDHVGISDRRDERLSLGTNLPLSCKGMLSSGTFSKHNLLQMQNLMPLSS
jgi:hypothetical protein